MSKKIKTVIFLFIIFNSLYSQNIEYFFGNVSQKDIDLKVYDKDPSAGAVIIYDMGKSYFKSLNEIVFERQKKIKILKQSGLQYADFEIYYYIGENSSEKIADLEAYTCNSENGKLNKTSLILTNVYNEKVTEKIHALKFAMPNVKVGSVIELQYKIISPFIFNLQDWTFQSTIPTMHSEYVVRLNPFFEYMFILQGKSKLDIQKSYKEDGIGEAYFPADIGIDPRYKDMIYHFGMFDVPAFKDETFITSINDYVYKIDFQLSKVNGINGSSKEIISTWKALNKDMLKDKKLGKFIEKSKRHGRKIFKSGELSQKNETEKLDSVLTYVKSNFSRYGSDSKYSNTYLKDFLKMKIGNSAALNLYAIGLLRALKIEVYPLLLSTRKHGKIKSDYPFLHFFNYVLIAAKINGNWVLADATDIYYPNDLIPIKCINELGLVVKKDKNITWLELAQNKPSEIKQTTFIQFSDDLKLVENKEKISAEGYYGITLRKLTEDNSEEIEDLLKENGINDFSNIQTKNYSERNKPYIIQYDEIRRTIKIKDKIILQPFTDYDLYVNDFKYSKREYPIDMIFSGRKIYNSFIFNPKGYQLKKMPDNFNLDNDNVHFSYQIIKNLNGYQANLIIQYKKSVYSPEDYSKLRYYNEQLIKHIKKALVFEKI